MNNSQLKLELIKRAIQIVMIKGHNGSCQNVIQSILIH